MTPTETITELEQAIGRTLTTEERWGVILDHYIQNRVAEQIFHPYQPKWLPPTNGAN